MDRASRTLAMFYMMERNARDARMWILATVLVTALGWFLYSGSFEPTPGGGPYGSWASVWWFIVAPAFPAFFVALTVGRTLAADRVLSTWPPEIFRGLRWSATMIATGVLVGIGTGLATLLLLAAVGLLPWGVWIGLLPFLVIASGIWAGLGGILAAPLGAPRRSGIGLVLVPTLVFATGAPLHRWIANSLEVTQDAWHPFLWFALEGEQALSG